jgi:[NiFe] hydrogenase diaphorase moiety large subunit
LLNISRTQIIGVVEFYSFFHLTPRGQYELLISDSITDHMLGKQSLIDYLSEKLNVAIGEVRQDGVVSLDNTSCTGMCDQGPAGLVNGYALTRLDRPRIDQITDLINQQKPLDQWPGELFQVEDNIIKSGLLLNQSINQGSALQSAFKRGLKETLTAVALAITQLGNGIFVMKGLKRMHFVMLLRIISNNAMSFVMLMKANPERLKTECC